MSDIKIPETHRLDITTLVRKNQDIFAMSDKDLGCTDTVEMTIDTGADTEIPQLGKTKSASGIFNNWVSSINLSIEICSIVSRVNLMTLKGQLPLHQCTKKNLNGRLIIKISHLLEKKKQKRVT
jgi:hypothetical protein